MQVPEAGDEHMEQWEATGEPQSGKRRGLMCVSRSTPAAACRADGSQVMRRPSPWSGTIGCWPGPGCWRWGWTEGDGLGTWRCRAGGQEPSRAGLRVLDLNSWAFGRVFRWVGEEGEISALDVGRGASDILL